MITTNIFVRRCTSSSNPNTLLITVLVLPSLTCFPCKHMSWVVTGQRPPSITTYTDLSFSPEVKAALRQALGLMA